MHHPSLVKGLKSLYNLFTFYEEEEEEEEEEEKIGYRTDVKNYEKSPEFFPLIEAL